MTCSRHHAWGRKRASCSTHIVEDKVWLSSTVRVAFCSLTGFLPPLSAQRTRHTRYGGRGQDAHFYIVCSVTERTPSCSGSFAGRTTTSRVTRLSKSSTKCSLKP